MQKSTSSQYFKTLSILCYALTAGVTILAIIMAAVRQVVDIDKGIPELVTIFDVMVPLFAAGGTFGGNIVFKSRLLAAKELPSLSEKLNGYRAAIILLYALLEGPGLFSIIAYFLTSDVKLLIVTACIIVLMLYRLPKKENLIKDLDLSFDESNVINDPDGVIE